jgi:4-alpha-glucanotransferase
LKHAFTENKITPEEAALLGNRHARVNWNRKGLTMPFTRASGILLHPTSLPGRFGIGSLGPEAYEFVDFLADTKQQLWQVLPLGPTGHGNSPYLSYSSMAGNPMLISLEQLCDRSLLYPDELHELEGLP